MLQVSILVPDSTSILRGSVCRSAGSVLNSLLSLFNNVLTFKKSSSANDVREDRIKKNQFLR